MRSTSISHSLKLTISYDLTLTERVGVMEFIAFFFLGTPLGRRGVLDDNEAVDFLVDGVMSIHSPLLSEDWLLLATDSSTPELQLSSLLSLMSGQ